MNRQYDQKYKSNIKMTGTTFKVYVTPRLTQKIHINLDVRKEVQLLLKQQSL